jgi:3-dehydroquinate dehydratase/shikimate dehydrogenase
MSPRIEETPVPRSAVRNFGLVFDSVYTPVWTRLLLDARDEGCQVVDGLQMFVGQAAEQFRLFTGREPPLKLMQETLMSAISASSVDLAAKR